MLETLEIDFPAGLSNSPFQLAMKLHQLTANANYIFMCIFKGVWPQLMKVEVVCGSVRQSLTVMQSLPNIDWHTIQLECHFDASSLDYPSIRLKHLGELIIIMTSATYLTGFYER